MGVKLSQRFEEALAFASRLHNSQYKKGTAVPYMAHLMGVAGLALEFEADGNRGNRGRYPIFHRKIG